jgi:hypothetical protein
MSNAGDDNSVVLNQLQDVATAGTDPSLCLLEWSAPQGCELDDTSAWQQANPGLGYTVSEAAIRSALGTDPPAIFRTEVLCQRVDQLNGAIDLAAWKDCADTGTMDAHRDRLAACFDTAPDGEHSTLAVAAKLDDGRVRVEIVAAWESSNAARAALPAVLAKVNPKALTWFSSGPAAGLATVMRPLALKYNRHPGPRRDGEPPEDGHMAGAAVTEVCQELADLTKARAVVHPGDPLLDAHVRGAIKLASGDGWRFARKDAGHCDAAYAAAGAVSTALAMPVPKKARIRMLG